MILKVAEGIKPTLAELEKFEDQPEGMQVECIFFMLVYLINTTKFMIIYNFTLKDYFQ